MRMAGIQLVSLIPMLWLGLAGSSLAQVTVTELDQLETAKQSVDKAKELAPFVPTPMEVVEKMLELARLTRSDTIYDLGSGDGRIVITAAKKYGTRAIGFEIDPDLVQESQNNAVNEGVGHLVQIREQDLMTADFSKATVVTIYLHPDSNLLVRPLLEKQLKPGARIVSNEFAMGDWQPDVIQEVADSRGDIFTVYLWRIKGKGSERSSR
ncbi:MAG: methyltransferase domain-containing protein [Deltaproteobacteria bacterium]|nr:methyltransferase domain-containing protein [Deltaproteobacteria bacterium]